MGLFKIGTNIILLYDVRIAQWLHFRLTTAVAGSNPAPFYGFSSSVPFVPPPPLLLSLSRAYISGCLAYKGKPPIYNRNPGFLRCGHRVIKMCV
jgi:hypothetical protein